MDTPKDVHLVAPREMHANPEGLLARPKDVHSLGGDPAADSPTATLLRLNPPYRT